MHVFCPLGSKTVTVSHDNSFANSINHCMFNDPNELAFLSGKTSVQYLPPRLHGSSVVVRTLMQNAKHWSFYHIKGCAMDFPVL